MGLRVWSGLCAAALMDARGMGAADEAVHFAQILGMADPLTLALAQVSFDGGCD